MHLWICLLYTSDAADDLLCVDLGGRRIIKKNDLEVINPCNEDPFAVISLGSKEDTDLAIKSAKIAFETWKETSKEERLNLLNKLLLVYKKRFGEMAEAISLEMGAPMDCLLYTSPSPRD